MTTAETLYAVLSGVAGAQDVSPNVAPDQVARPNIVYTLLVEAPRYTMQGRSNYAPARYQLDVYAQTYPAAQALADSVQVAMDAARTTSFSCTQQARHDMYEPLGKLHRVVLDYLIWHT